MAHESILMNKDQSDVFAVQRASTLQGKEKMKSYNTL